MLQNSVNLVQSVYLIIWPAGEKRECLIEDKANIEGEILRSRSNISFWQVPNRLCCGSRSDFCCIFQICFCPFFCSSLSSFSFFSYFSSISPFSSFLSFSSFSSHFSLSSSSLPLSIFQPQTIFVPQCHNDKLNTIYRSLIKYFNICLTLG